MKTEQDQMPREVATALLASNQKQSNTFRKVCHRATERNVTPETSAPKTAIQRMEAKIGKLNAVQLNRWLKRTQRVANAICDRIDELEMQSDPDQAAEPAQQDLLEQIEQLSAIRARYDTLATAIISELDTRSNRGKIKV